MMSSANSEFKIETKTKNAQKIDVFWKRVEILQISQKLDRLGATLKRSTKNDTVSN